MKKAGSKRRLTVTLTDDQYRIIQNRAAFYGLSASELGKQALVAGFTEVLEGLSKRLAERAAAEAAQCTYCAPLPDGTCTFCETPAV